MEKVLEELKRIEDEAENIRLESSKKAEEIVRLARQRSEKLIADAERDAEKDVSELMEKFRNLMKKRHNEILKNCELKIDRLRKTAEKKMNSAVDQIFKIVIGEKET